MLGWLVLLATGYMRWYRPWQLRWGSTEEEARRAMPGDEVVQHPSFDATRAVTIAAPRDCIYPWLVQIGVGRAGWYSYDHRLVDGADAARFLSSVKARLEAGDFAGELGL